MSRKIIRYSDCFKQSVVSEIEKNGLTMQQARDSFGIKGTNTIQLWLKKYGRHHLLNKVVRVETKDQINELTQLREENKRLKIAYSELAIDHKLSEKVLEKGDEMMGLDLKKSTNKRYHRSQRRNKCDS